MEVHHHPHVGKKIFKEYLLEGLMIFVAVTMGFIAENIRENISHREKEKKQIESFINTLDSDSAQLAFVIRVNDTIVENINRFTELRKKEKDESFIRDFYNYSANGLIMEIYFKPNLTALDEMKASGIIGSLHYPYIADSIFKYQQHINVIESQQADCYWIYKEAFGIIVNSIGVNDYLDPNYVKFTLGETNEFANTFHFQFIKYPPLEIPDEKNTLRKLFSNAAALGAANQSMILLLKDHLSYNKRLKSLLKKAYQLD